MKFFCCLVFLIFCACSESFLFAILFCRNSKVFQQEPELPNVKDEDKIIVRNVLYAASYCAFDDGTVDNWNVSVEKRGYVVNMYLNNNADIQVTLQDLLTIEEVNPLRICNVSVVKNANSTTCVRVFVMNCDQPITLTKTDIVRVRKRAKWGIL